MSNYLQILNRVVHSGIPKQAVRFDSNDKATPVENGTRGIFGEVYRHDMQDGFPLLTTKKMAWKTICVELEGFIKGITNKEWYQERGCRIWNEWANPETVRQESQKQGYYRHPPIWFDPKEFTESVTDLGPIYGCQWRAFDEHYVTNRTEWYNTFVTKPNGVAKGTDQLIKIADRLRENPYDRRMVCSAWNPNQVNMMALPPCHYAWNVVVYGDTLNLQWTQRSCDIFLGVPFNIASYALLLHLLAAHAGLKPGQLKGDLNDCHIYDNQIDQAVTQLCRNEFPAPQVKFTHDGNIFNWTHEDVVLEDYECHDPIKADVTI